MGAYRNELVIQLPQKCECCSGTGTVQGEISLGNLLDILSATNGINDKIAFIKAIRARWPLSLINCKELAEVAIDFTNKASKVGE